MFSFVKSLTIKQLIVEQIPSFGISFIIAELFFKFHSFTFECIAFLATWYVLDALIQAVKNAFSTKAHKVHQ